MSEQVPEYRPDIWSGPEGRAIRNEFIENGYGETVRTVDALRSIDAKAFGEIAIGLYGTSRSDTRERAAELASESNAEQDAEIPTELRAIEEYIDSNFTNVSNAWHGDAFKSARSYNRRLRDVTLLEADRSAILGDALIDFAIAVEDAVSDSEEAVLGAANLLWAEVGLGVSLATGGSGAIAMAATSMVITTSSGLQKEIDRRQEEVDEVDLVTVDLEELQSDGKLQGVPLEDLMPDFPDDSEGWEANHG